jgi:cytochrome P450
MGITDDREKAEEEMSEINRMAHPIVPTCPADIDLTDQDFRECPYPGFELLREDAPVWYDERTKVFVVTRYDDIRAVMLDPKTFTSIRPREADIVKKQASRSAADQFFKK